MYSQPHCERKSYSSGKTLKILFLFMFRRQPSVQDPDLIPSLVGHAPVPPDICIASNDTSIPKNTDENSSELDSEYGALVSSIHVKPKENNYEDSFNNEDNDPSGYSSTQPLIRNSPTPALAISLDSLDNNVPESPVASSYSSQSGSESRNQTPVKGKSSSSIQFSLDSCTHCDHRLKLFLETKLFRGGDDEEFRCMIKVSRYYLNKYCSPDRVC